MLRREKGFTLIELLIVVAIIGIIAAIAVPNLLTAIQRSKRSRSAADMRAIGTALGSYLVDHNIFPNPATSVWTTLSDLGYYEGATSDGWNTEFSYARPTVDDYTLKSFGKEGDSTGTGEFDSDIVYINGQFYTPAALSGK